MPVIRLVTLTDGSTRWAIQYAGKTMRSLFGPGFAYHNTRSEADARYESYCEYIEQMSS